MAVALTVFLAVTASFVCQGAFDAKNSVGEVKKEVKDYIQKNIYISVCDAGSNTLDTNYIASFDPKDMTVSLIKMPADTLLKIASSNQMLKDVVNIGGAQMLREQLEKTIPLPIDYHLIIKSSDLYSENGNYADVVEYVLSSYLWQVPDLKNYLTQFLSLSSTDLTLMRTEEYSAFLEKFQQHTNRYYNLPGKREYVGDKVFFVTDYKQLNDLINNEINN